MSKMNRIDISNLNQILTILLSNKRERPPSKTKNI